VLLDACVLLPYQLADLLLRLADAEMFEPLWSEEILVEVERNLVEKFSVTTEKASRRVGHMRAAFPNAGVCVLFVAWPAKDWAYTPSATIILERIDAGDDEATIRRFITSKMIEGADRNYKKPKDRQIAFRVAAALLVAEIALLVGALALY
jgi:hypothetical protein